LETAITPVSVCDNKENTFLLVIIHGSRRPEEVTGVFRLLYAIEGKLDKEKRPGS
jgi:hypothetical protein